MLKQFRETHLFRFLHRLDQHAQPIDAAFSNYLRTNRSIGAHDRRFLGDTIYSLIRWKGLLDYLLNQPEPTWPQRYAQWQALDLSSLPSYTPSWARSGGSRWLFEELSRSYGEARAQELCRILNEPAPLTIRANLLKTTREALFASLEERFAIERCEEANTGIRFRERAPLTSLPEFKEGLFEIQDEGSQLIAHLIQAEPGDQVLDFCSGSGGKSLGLAPRMQGRGQLYLHDIRPWILQEARKRFRRAGIQHAQFLPPDHPRLPSLKNKMDWVLADVPCSGSGTYRRNPDMKWKMEEDQLCRLIEEQRLIFTQALEFVRPGGYIVYATCSIFTRENQAQVDHFLKLPIDLVSSPLATFPSSGGMDGFFAAVFRKNPC